MVGSTGTLMTMRLVRSKLRKREETSVSPVNIEAQTTATTITTQQQHHHHNNHHNNYHHQPSQVLSITTKNTEQQQQQQQQSGCNGQQQQSNNNQPIAYRQNPSSVWVFPPLPPQPNIYNCANHHVSTNKKFNYFISKLNLKSGIIFNFLHYTNFDV